jgi:peptidoglycan hydrolase CwlO-like protein
MQIDISILIAVVSLGLSAAVGISGLKRAKTQDDKKDASSLTTLLVKIENINNGINEIKSDMRGVRADIQDVRERLVIVEQSVKSAHHRIDNIEGGKKNEQ